MYQEDRTDAEGMYVPDSDEEADPTMKLKLMAQKRDKEEKEEKPRIKMMRSHCEAHGPYDSEEERKYQKRLESPRNVARR